MAYLINWPERHLYETVIILTLKINVKCASKLYIHYFDKVLYHIIYLTF